MQLTELGPELLYIRGLVCTNTEKLRQCDYISESRPGALVLFWDLVCVIPVKLHEKQSCWSGLKHPSTGSSCTFAWYWHLRGSVTCTAQNEALSHQKCAPTQKAAWLTNNTKSMGLALPFTIDVEGLDHQDLSVLVWIHLLTVQHHMICWLWQKALTTARVSAKGCKIEGYGSMQGGLWTPCHCSSSHVWKVHLTHVWKVHLTHVWKVYLTADCIDCIDCLHCVVYEMLTDASAVSPTDREIISGACDLLSDAPHQCLQGLVKCITPDCWWKMEIFLSQVIPVIFLSLCDKVLVALKTIIDIRIIVLWTRTDRLFKLWTVRNWKTHQCFTFVCCKHMTCVWMKLYWPSIGYIFSDTFVDQCCELNRRRPRDTQVHLSHCVNISTFISS